MYFKTKKNITVIILLVFLLSACSGGEKGANSTDEIELVVFGPAQMNSLAPNSKSLSEIEKKIISGFLEENPEIDSVVWDSQGPLEQASTRMMTAHLGNEEIDLIACSANQTNSYLIGNNVVMDITEQANSIEDRFEPSALEAFKRDGNIYGVPITYMSTTSFFYNKDIFEEFGLEIPETYEELLNVSQELEGSEYIPVLHQGKDMFMWPIWYFESLGQTSNDPVEKTISNLRGETKFTDSEDVEAFKWIANFVEDGILDESSLTTDTDGVRSAFATGQAAMWYVGTWELPWIQENITDFEVGVFEYPQLPDVKSTPKHGGGPENGICIYSGIDEEKIPYAMDFIEYLSRPEIADLYLESDKPFATSIKGAKTVDTPMNNELKEKHIPNNTRFLDWIWPEELNDEFQSSIQGVVSGSLTAEEAAQQIQEKYESMVANGYEYGQDTN